LDPPGRDDKDSQLEAVHSLTSLRAVHSR